MLINSPLLNRPGAAVHQEETSIDVAGVAWHYGNPLGEQNAIDSGNTGTIIVDRSHRAVITVSGSDAPGFLNNLLSQKLDDVPAGFAATALDLDIQGHILHAADLSFDGSTYFLDLPHDKASSLHDFLNKMKFWSDVDITLADVAVLTLLTGAHQRAELANVASSVLPQAVLVREFPWAGRPRIDVLVKRSELESSVQALEASGMKLAGLMAYTAERVRAREPELEADLDNKSIPHEIPHWIGRENTGPGAVHLEKGCYRGQETVARVENLGRSPRLLVQLHLDGSAPTLPEPGSDIMFAGRKVGRLGTVVHDCDFGPTALALVKRSALDRGELTIGANNEVAASIDPDSLPKEDEPKAGRAAIERLRGNS